MTVCWGMMSFSLILILRRRWGKTLEYLFYPFLVSFLFLYLNCCGWVRHAWGACLHVILFFVRMCCV